ncbi:MRG domain-containing protein [Cephalotus follicularis]|uniref:MRG domain-containing protein n=1 Tax=Cephalotus follicularis TaxID=3775 RepID=A0A1Q3BH44_CEPFO|nr:MRG domain-containing protein [Cephalotus follicularis]
MDRLFKHNEENPQKITVNKMQVAEINAKTRHASQIKSKASDVASGKKRKNDSLIKDKDAVPSEKLLNLQIPPTLKKQLVDDCEFITLLGKHVKLPRSPNVDSILQMFGEDRLKKGLMLDDSVREILKGLGCYFDKALPVMLLYQNERKQYEDAIKNDISPSSVYGAEHLLRLFVKLPELLGYVNIEEETVTLLQQTFVDFLKFLQKNQSQLFLSTYHVTEDTDTSTNEHDD